MADQIQKNKPEKTKDLNNISQTLRTILRQQIKEGELTLNPDGYVHIHDLIMNMTMKKDDSITPQDIRKILECRTPQLAYQREFITSKNEKGIFLNDTRNKEDDEDLGKHGDAKSPADDEEVHLIQLHHIFLTAEQVKSLRLEILKNRYYEKGNWIQLGGSLQKAQNGSKTTAWRHL